MTKVISKLSSKDEKKGTAEAVYETLADFFFDKVSFISYAFSEVTNGGYTGSTFRGWSRLPNTAGGKFLVTDRNSRMRLHFYVKNPTSIIGYILSPAVFDDTTSLNDIASLDILRGYVGLKINLGTIYVVVKEAGKSEVLYDTNIKLTNTGESETYRLEMRYGAKTTQVFIDDIQIGSFATDFSTGFDEPQSFLPLFSPAKSSNGTSINITIENFQYIQDK
jgi:hypothetical protein